MSLLKELKKTVIEGQIVSSVTSGGSGSGSTIYTLRTGYIEPRDQLNLLVLDNETDEPVTTPENTFPIATYMIPETAITSTDLDSSYLNLYVYDDTSFSNGLPIAGGFNGYQVNTLCSNEMIATSTLMSDVIDYPYIGFESSADFLSGKIQVVMYFLPATLPPLP